MYILYLHRPFAVAYHIIWAANSPSETVYTYIYYYNYYPFTTGILCIYICIALGLYFKSYMYTSYQLTNCPAYCQIQIWEYIIMYSYFSESIKEWYIYYTTRRYIFLTTAVMSFANYTSIILKTGSIVFLYRFTYL